MIGFYSKEFFIFLQTVTITVYKKILAPDLFSPSLSAG